MNTRTLLPVYLIVALFGVLGCCAPVAYGPSALHQKMMGLAEKFDRFDSDGDRYLTRQELEDGLRMEDNLRLTPAQMERVMTAYDCNHDLMVSRSEAQFGAAYGPEIFGESMAGPRDNH